MGIIGYTARRRAVVIYESKRSTYRSRFADRSLVIYRVWYLCECARYTQTTTPWQRRAHAYVTGRGEEMNEHYDRTLRSQFSSTTSLAYAMRLPALLYQLGGLPAGDYQLGMPDGDQAYGGCISQHVYTITARVFSFFDFIKTSDNIRAMIEKQYPARVG